MKYKKLIIGGFIVALVVTVGLVLKAVSKPADNEQVAEETIESSDIVPLDPAITVDVKSSAAKANTIVLTVVGLGGKMVKVGYEVSYDSNGLIKGVSSQPLDVTGKDTFDREIYLGTCSRNVCKPDTGVTAVTVSLEFTDAAGKKSQFSKDFDI